MHFEEWLREPDKDQLVRAVTILDSRPADALPIFQNLAKVGSATSMLYVGYIYRDGLGRPADTSEAEKWFRMAADAGSIIAYHSLGNLYGSSKRWRDAREAFAIAGAKDYGPALNQLGRMYAAGLGVEKDARRAIQYFERASAEGHLPGRIALGRLLMRDSGSRIERARGLFLYLVSWPFLFFTLLREGYGSERLR